MIQANEIRIGNCFLANGKGIKVESIYNDKVNIDISIAYDSPDVDGYRIDELQPIPLTPELLDKYALSKSSLIYSFFYGNGEWFELYADGKEIIQAIPDSNPVAEIGAEYFNSYYYVGKPLQYLHELQNRFYSFTGEELSINL